jgi:RNA polymerase sigma-70 factor (ECF subfamily)
MTRDSAGSEDAALVQAVAERDQDALAALYERHAKAVFDYARSTVGQRTVAEEVVQDVFVRLWRQPERYDPTRGSVRTYLVTLAYGRSVDMIRSESARRRREERSGREGVRSIDATEVSSTQADEVHGALAELTYEQREAITLAYFLGYSYREVAVFLKVPEGTIKNRIRTGLIRLREHLSATEPRLAR